MVAYLIAAGRYNEALNYLELGLATNPQKHAVLFEYLPQLQDNKAIAEVIKKYMP